MGAPAWSRTLPSILPVEPWARSEPAPKPKATAASAKLRAARAKALTQLCFMDTSSKGVDLRLLPAWSGRLHASPFGLKAYIGMRLRGMSACIVDGKGVNSDLLNASTAARSGA